MEVNYLMLLAISRNVLGIWWIHTRFITWPSLLCFSVPVPVDTAVEMPDNFPYLQVASTILLFAAFSAAPFLPLVVSALFNSSLSFKKSSCPLSGSVLLVSQASFLLLFVCNSSSRRFFFLGALVGSVGQLFCAFQSWVLPGSSLSSSGASFSLFYRFMPPTVALLLVLFVLFALMALVVLFLLLTCLLENFLGCCLLFPAVHSTLFLNSSHTKLW